MRPFTFFAPELLGEQITLLSLQSMIGTDSDAVAAAIIQAIKQTGARVVVIDGFQGMINLFPNPGAIPRLFATLSTRFGYLDATMLVTLEGASRDPTLGHHVTTADVVLGLEYAVAGLRHTRYVEVVKQRGQAPLAGLHPYTITSSGITVYPRLEERPLLPARPRPSERAPFGLPELDALLSGGPTGGSITILAGSPGAGKTTLGLHWALSAAQPDQQRFFSGSQSAPNSSARKARSSTWMSIRPWRRAHYT